MNAFGKRVAHDLEIQPWTADEFLHKIDCAQQRQSKISVWCGRGLGWEGVLRGDTFARLLERWSGKREWEGERDTGGGGMRRDGSILRHRTRAQGGWMANDFVTE